MTAAAVLDPAIKFTFSPEIDKLAPALVKFQKAMKTVLKAATAKVEKEGRLLYTYAYADFADVVEASREPLADADLAVIQPPVGSSADGITIVTIVLHSSGQWLRGDLTMKPLDQKPQTVGSLITYNRRYCYSGALGIVTEKDDDGAAAQGKPAIKGNAQPANKVKAASDALMANATQIQQIHILKEKIGGWTGKADHDKHPYRAALLAYKDADGKPCQSSKDLTFEQASNLIKRMQATFDGQAMNAKRMEDQAPIAGAMNDNDREPGADDGDPGEPLEAGQLADLRQAAIDKWGKKVKDLAPQWLQKEFGVSEAAALSKVEATRALQMLLSGNVLS